MFRGGPLAHPQPAPAIGRHHALPHRDSPITSLPHLRRSINDQYLAAAHDTDYTALQLALSTDGPGRSVGRRGAPAATAVTVAATAVITVIAVTAVAVDTPFETDVTVATAVHEATPRRQ